MTHNKRKNALEDYFWLKFDKNSNTIRISLKICNSLTHFHSTKKSLFPSTEMPNEYISIKQQLYMSPPPTEWEPKVPNKHQLASVTTPATSFLGSCSPNLFPKLAQTEFGDEFGVPLTPGNKTTFSCLFFFPTCRERARHTTLASSTY